MSSDDFDAQSLAEKLSKLNNSQQSIECTYKFPFSLHFQIMSLVSCRRDWKSSVVMKVPPDSQCAVTSVCRLLVV